jgi:hypothetical protein
LIGWPLYNRAHIEGMIARLKICTAMSGGAGYAARLGFELCQGRIG